MSTEVRWRPAGVLPRMFIWVYVAASCCSRAVVRVAVCVGICCFLADWWDGLLFLVPVLCALRADFVMSLDRGLVALAGEVVGWRAG